MSTRVTATAAIELPCPPEQALPAIWEIADIERFEVKADKVSVHPRDSRTGTYDVRGRFAGIPWSGQFEYELDDRGFHSRTADVSRAATMRRELRAMRATIVAAAEAEVEASAGR